MNNSESGRKLNQAVNTTSKAVGGAILQAKGALSTWWSAMTTQPLVVAQSDTQESTQIVPTEHTSCQDTKDISNYVDNVSQPSTAQSSPEKGIGKGEIIGGIVEIGHEAVSTLDANTAGKVFTV